MIATDTFFYSEGFGVLCFVKFYRHEIGLVDIYRYRININIQGAHKCSSDVFCIEKCVVQGSESIKYAIQVRNFRLLLLVKNDKY